MAWRCIACGNRTFRSRGHKKGYEIRQCDACGQGVLDPIPSRQEVAELYQSYHMTGRYLAKTEKKIRRARRRVARLRKLTAGNRFLDIGCNVGAAVQAASDAGFEAMGIDLDEAGVKIARQQVSGAQFEAMSAEILADTGRQYDVIYSAEVIEHAIDPLSFVSALAKLTAPDGVVYLTTPDMGHWRVPKSLPDWNEFNPPFHIHYFNQRSLRFVFAGCGFDRIWYGFNWKPGIRLFAKRQRK